MNLPDTHDLLWLAEEHGDTRLSLFLPLRPGAAQSSKTRIQGKNLLRQAEHALRAQTSRPAEVDVVIDAAQRILDDTRMFEQGGAGLALYVAPERARSLHVPMRLEELAVAGNRFAIGPLLPMLTAGGRFVVLTLSQDEIRLFRGTRFALEQVKLDGLPLAAWQTMPRPHLPRPHAFLADRGGVGNQAVFHGTSAAAEARKARILHHLRGAEQALRQVLRGEEVPLVLAGVRQLQARYRQVNTYPHLLTDAVDGSPRGISLDQLHKRAWAIAEPMLRRDETAALGRHAELQGTGRTVDNLADALPAAQSGRVDTLLIRDDTWRSSSPDGRTIVRLPGSPAAEERMELTALATLRHAGTVFTVTADRMPERAPIAATLRY